MTLKLLLIILSFYLIFVLMFRYILAERLKLIDMIFHSKKPNKRNELLEKRKKAKDEIRSSWLWPILLFREIKNGKKQKK